MKTAIPTENQNVNKEVELKLMETLSENELLKQMMNLKQDEFYRMQKISILTKINDNLELIAKKKNE
jgi:hypothetical protein